MKTNNLFTVTGKLWHYHLIGVGIILTYSELKKEVYFISEATGLTLHTVEMFNIGGYKNKEAFVKDSKTTFFHLIEDKKLNLNHELMDDPTIIETPLGNIGVDFSTMVN